MASGAWLWGAVKNVAAWAALGLLWSLFGASLLGAGVILLRIAWIAYPIAIAALTASVFLAFLFKRSKLPPVTFLGQLAFVVWGPIYVVGLTMPLRATGVAFFPDPRLAPFDVGVAAAGALVALVVTARDAAWRRRQLAQLENLPTSRVAAAAAGLVELRGVARAATGESKPGDVLIQRTLKPFSVEDETGRVKVDPAGARFRPFWANAFEGRGCEVTLPKHTLRDGDPVYVIGSLEQGPSGERVVRPRVEAKDGFLWRTLFTYKEKGTEPQRDLQHVFFVSTRDEQAARRHLLNGLRQILVLGGVWLVLSTVLAAIQVPRAISTDAWSVEEIAGHAPKELRATLLLKRLKDGDRAERTKILELAHPFVYKESLPIIFYALGDPDPALARKAADELNPDSYETWTQLHLKAAPYHFAAIEGLRRGLASPDAKVRRLSLSSSARISPATAAVDVAPLLKDSDVAVRKTAARALQEAGKAAIGALADLRAALTDPDASVKEEVMTTLRKILDGDPRYTGVFLDHLSSPDAVVRAGAAGALAYGGPESAEALIRLLDDPDPKVRREAAYSLQWPGKGKREATLALIRSSKDPDGGVRSTAIRALDSSNVRPALDGFVPLLAAALDDSDYKVREAAAGVLRNLGPAAAPAAGRLGPLLLDSSGTVREHAGEALAKLGPAAALAVPDLARALESADRSVRTDAIRVAGKLGPTAGPVVEALTRATSDPNYREHAIKSLGRLGAAGGPAVHALAELLSARDEGYRSALLEALGSIGPAATDAVPAILAIAEARGGSHREMAFRTLGRIGPGAKGAVPRLIPFLEGQDQSVVRAALREIGPGDAAALGELRARFAASSEWLRKMYGELLCPYGEEAADLFPSILALMEESYEGSFATAFAAGGRPALAAATAWLGEPLLRRRQVGCDMLRRMGPRAAPSLEAVAALLKDPDQYLRAKACEVLAAIGPAAAPATDPLVDLIRKDDVVVKALEALAAIGPAAAPAAPELLRILGSYRADATLRAILQLPKGESLQRAALEAMTCEAPGTQRALLLGRVAMSTQDGPTVKNALAALAAWTEAPDRAAPLILLAASQPYPETKDAMIRALQDIDPTGRTALRASMQLIRAGDPHLAREGARILRTAGTGAVDVLPDLLECLKSGHANLKVLVVESIGRIGPDARAAEEQIVAFLRQARGEDVVVAALALARIGAGPEAVAELAAKSRDYRFGRTAEILTAAQSRLRSQGVDAPGPRERAVLAAKSVDEIRSGMKDPHPAVRLAAAQRLEEMKGEAAGALLELAAALSDSSIAVRWLSARALGHLQQSAAPAVPALARALGDEDREVAAEAAASIARTGPAARAARVEVLAAYRKRVGHAVAALAALGPDAAEAVPDLVLALRPGTYPVEELRALGGIGPDAKPAVPHIAPFLDHKDGYVRQAAGEALRGIGPAAAEAIPALLERLGRQAPGTMDPAQRALGGIGEAAVPGLIEVLRTGKSPARISAAWTLREIGPPARAAVPALIETLRKNETSMLLPAIGALSGIGPDALAAAPHLESLARKGSPIGPAAQEALRRLNAPR